MLITGKERVKDSGTPTDLGAMRFAIFQRNLASRIIKIKHSVYRIFECGACRK